MLTTYMCVGAFGAAMLLIERGANATEVDIQGCSLAFQAGIVIIHVTLVVFMCCLEYETCLLSSCSFYLINFCLFFLVFWLLCAARSGSTDMMRELLQRYDPLTMLAPNNTNTTPLHHVHIT